MSKLGIFRVIPLFTAVAAVLLFSVVTSDTAYAQKIDCQPITEGAVSAAADIANIKTGILPGTKLTFEQCYCLAKSPTFFNAIMFKKIDSFAKPNYLACGIRTGQVKLFMIPYFITSLIQFALVLAGIVSVLFLVIGGYQFVTGGLTDEVDTAKKTITYAIAGLVVTILSWIIVNIVQVAVTG